jgi:hypothetical protein
MHGYTVKAIYIPPLYGRGLGFYGYVYYQHEINETLLNLGGHPIWNTTMQEHCTVFIPKKQAFPYEEHF